MKKIVWSKQLLSIMISNAETRICYIQGETIRAAQSFSTPQHITADEARAQLDTCMQDHDIQTLDGIVWASVVPELTYSWQTALKQIKAAKLLYIKPGIKTGIKIGYDDPAAFGSDRLAHAVAALSQLTGPLVIIDANPITTTLDVIDAHNTICGGIISCAPALAAATLARHASKLPNFEFHASAHSYGHNTTEALQLGLLVGEARKLDSFIADIQTDFGRELLVIGTGSACPLLTEHMRTALTTYELQLVHLGLAQLWYLNCL
ncbi:type III pantothenate kinase [Collinsella sp. zg1085]|uniref:type III pantothenate kinase n=1 Tax=Collinsella sp. zg1085 TaxID=2844380 RepID=UPI001C0B1DD4|nr:type III pantothenate kinase [Collinsella sp. zg1085]QWT17147.1 type III pantothenate kinase [Collinsella sp. zg1085]